MINVSYMFVEVFARILLLEFVFIVLIYFIIYKRIYNKMK
jgi:hypothetical protein